jgi:hypothetical protein
MINNVWLRMVRKAFSFACEGASATRKKTVKVTERTSQSDPSTRDSVPWAVTQRYNQIPASYLLPMRVSTCDTL